MSLKNIFKKAVASLGAISLIFSNCSLFGIGLSKVIAEDISSPDIIAEIRNEKYVQYKEEIEEGLEQQEDIKKVAGVSIHSVLSIYPNQNQDTYLPTEEVEVGINLPSINGYLPQTASVVEAKTQSTTGELLNTKIDQNYDSNSGLLTMFYENVPDQEGDIYSKYIENAKDEFEIIYTYPQEAYTGNETEVKLNYIIDVNMTFKTEVVSITSNTNRTVEITEKENKADIATFDTTYMDENIYKGFMYLNVKNKTNYETNYKTVSTLCILDSAFTDELVMELQESRFELNDEEKTEVLSNGIYKQTKISKSEFDKILGQNGFIQFYKNDDVIATVQYIQVEDANKLAVIYDDENVDILDDKDSTIVVEYPEDLSSLKIKISEQIAEGFIHFENQNTIKASEEYGCKVEKINKLATKSVINQYSNDSYIEMIEPETKISVNSSNINFSTLQDNKTTLTINLDDTNASTKLFDNPTIEVKLPNGLKYAEISSPRIVNGNGLEIIEEPSVDKENNIIKIKLSGKQTSYDLNNVSGGVSIVMDLEKIDFEDTLPTHADRIDLTCIQEDETSQASCDINIVSKTGLLILSKLYDNSNSITTMDSDIKTMPIEAQGTQKDLIHSLNLVNNYEEDLTSVEIIGKIGYSDGNISSTFDIELTKQLEIENGEVYYSNNKDANYDDDSWQAEYTSQAKAFKVVLSNEVLSKTSNTQINTYITVPENIGFNQETYLNYNVKYNYQETNKEESLTLGIATPKKVLEENALISVELLSPEDLTEGTIVYEYNANEIIGYNVKIKNLTENKLNNLKLEYETPENLEYVDGGLLGHDEYGEYILKENGTLTNNIFEYNIQELEPQEELTVLIKYKVKRLQQGNTATISSVANVTIGEDKYNSNIKNINVSQASYQMNLTSNIEENQILKIGDIVAYTIEVKNTGKRNETVIINDIVPEQIQIDKIEYGELGKELTTITTSSQDINLNIHLLEGEAAIVKITGQVKDQKVEETTTFDLVNTAKVITGQEELLSDELKLQLTVEVPEKEDNNDNNNQDSDEGNKDNEEQEGIKPEQPSNPEEDNNNEQITPEYTISGSAWIDENKNGKKDENEKLQDSVVVSLIDNKIGNFALDKNGNRIKTVTDSSGRYTFSNIPEGSYIVLFEFDTNTYTVSTYKKTDIEENLNSDAILTSVTIDGIKKSAAVTDTISLNSNKDNIDIGLMQNAIFDLSLNKQITKITVINSKGTEINEYEDGETAKVDLVAKYMKGANIIVNYKFTITNNGDVVGFVDSLVDDIPNGLEFSSELNKDWYKGNDGKLYTASLSEKAIKPGESTQIELVLTKTMTEDNTGVFPNNAELDKISNLENIKEKEEAQEDNQSSATLIISIKTGSVMLYTGITLLSILIILAGTYLIKKKVLNRGI